MFRVGSLGVEYPECLDDKNPYDAQEIRDKGITEIRIILLIVKRMHFKNQEIEKTIYDAMVEQYPNLEIITKYFGEHFPRD